LQKIDLNIFRTAASVTPRVRWTARRARATARSGATSNSP